MPGDRPTPDDWLARYPDLKKISGELKGPCPSCGGTDRFHVRLEEPHLFGCRQCEDGGAILRAAGLSGWDPVPRVEPAVPPEPPTARSLPDGVHYLYRDAAGALALAVVRQDLPGGKRFSQWRPFQDGWVAGGIGPGRPLYRLLDLLARPDAKVVVVEGEKCAQALAAAWPSVVAISWAGGSNAVRHSDWTPLSGRDVTVLADADGAGRKCAAQIAGILHDLGCDVRVAMPDGDTGEDVADWLDRGVEFAKGRISALLQSWPLPGANVPDDDAAASFVLDRTPHYVILGNAGDHVAFSVASRILLRTRESLTQPATLIALAPLSFWGQHTGTGSLSAGDARALGDALIRAADRIGQVDITTAMGRGAARLQDRSVVYHLGDRLLVDGSEDPLDSVPGLWIAEPRVELAASAPADIVQFAALAIQAYRWRGMDDAKRFLGWVVCSLVGGALPWRPHLLLTGPAAQGKSWLIREVLAPLLGDMLVRVADATPAAIARLTAHSAQAIAIDEAEPSHDWVVELLKLIRIASGGDGLRLRADATGGVVAHAPRFSAFLSATSAPRMNAADSSRLTQIRLGDAVPDWPAVSASIREAMADAEAIRARFIRSAGSIVDAARAIAISLESDGMDSRNALASASLTAGWRAWGVSASDVVLAHGADGGSLDAGRCLADILAIRHRKPGGVEQSLASLLAGGDPLHEGADLYGVRTIADGGLLVAPGHSGLAAQLRRGEWARVDLAGLLMQLPDTEYLKARRFGPSRLRAVLIPAGTLMEAVGVSFLSPPEGEP